MKVNYKNVGIIMAMIALGAVTFSILLPFSVGAVANFFVGFFGAKYFPPFEHAA